MHVKRWVMFAVAVSLVASGALVAAGERVTPSDIRQSLFEACFISRTDGWIVGDLGRILHTTDAGQTFELLDAGTKRAFGSIVCRADGTLIVTGQSGIMYRSTNHGQSWQQQQSGTERNLLSLAFAGKEVGVAVGDAGTILRTEDGGITWHKIAMPESVPLPEEAALTVMPGDILLYDVALPTPERGWIVGEFGVILTTSDGGLTWAAQSSPVQTTLFGVAFTDAQNGWAVGVSGVMLRTRDGGQTWQQVAVPSRIGFALSLYDIAVQGQYGWAAGDSGFLLNSKDGGNTWELAEVPIELAGTWFRGLGLLPDGKGFIVGADGLILSIDRQSFVPLRKL